MIWTNRMLDRFEELDNRVQQERDNLSEWRKPEALDLALTKEEQEERRELQRILRMTGDLL